MHLNHLEVKRFYNIWFPLLYYVNQHLKLVPSFPDSWGDSSVSPDLALSIRTSLWEHDELREQFIAENPAKLSKEDLTLVDSWKHRVTGNFFIFRYLKKYNLFMTESSPAKVYAVLGLTSPFEEILGPNLPIYVQTVLIPFEDKITFDSLMSSYPIFFGGGIKRSLNEAYRDVQERGNLITSLPPIDQMDIKSIQASNKKILSAFQKDLGKSGLSPKMMQEHIDNMAQFANEFLLVQKPPQLLLDISAKTVQAYLRQTPKANLVSLKRYIRFLRDSDRMDWDDAEDILKILKK